MSEKSLYLEEDHVFEVREKRDLIKKKRVNNSVAC